MDLFHFDQFICRRTESDLLSVCKTAFPFGFGAGVFEMVVVIAEIMLRHIVGKLASGQRLLLHASVNARAVERKRICGCEHTDVGKDGGIVLCMAVAVGRNVNDQ